MLKTLIKNPLGRDIRRMGHLFACGHSLSRIPEVRQSFPPRPKTHSHPPKPAISTHAHGPVVGALERQKTHACSIGASLGLAQLERRIGLAQHATTPRATPRAGGRPLGSRGAQEFDVAPPEARRTVAFSGWPGVGWPPGMVEDRSRRHGC